MDYVIPYHTSGMNATLRKMAGIHAWKDYTSTQHARKDPKAKKPANADKWQVEPVWSEFYVPEGKNGLDIMRKTAQRYIDMCHERGLIPKFDQFMDEPGYWKLLVDRKMVNQVTGEIVEQKPVKPIFDFDLIKQEIDREVSQYDPQLEKRALKYVVDNFDAVHQRIRDLKKGHPKKPMLKMANEILQAYAEGSKGPEPGKKYSKKGGKEIAADIQRMVEQYGRIEAGEKPFREATLPKKTAPGKNVSQTVRTVLEAEATPEIILPDIYELASEGHYSFESITDKQAIQAADAKITDRGWAGALAEWTKTVAAGKVSKENTATGWALYNHAANAGDTKAALEILDNMVLHQRSAAQALQATRILKNLTPEAQLYNVTRSVKNLQEELDKRYGEKHGFKVEINENLAERFLQAQTDKTREEVLTEIYRDIGRQMPSRFMDKWNAWRYLAMLGNPRTHVRNIVGNAGFAPVVAAKNVTATGIESTVNFVSRGKTGRTKSIITGATAKDRALLGAAWTDYAKAEELILAGGKYDDLQRQRKEIEAGRVIFKTKPLEAARRFNSAAMDQEDSWFAKPHYASSNDLSGLVTIAASAATSYITQAFPTLLGQIERSSEAERMTSYTDKNNRYLTTDMQYTIGKVSAKLPGWDFSQIPYIDAWGRTESSGKVGTRVFNNMLNPSYTSTIVEGEMEEELLRLYMQTDESVFPSRAAKYFNVDGERKDLTAEEYVKYATIKGQTSYEVVSELLKSKAYKGMNDEKKARAVEDSYTLANQLAKSKISDYAPDSWVVKAMEAKKSYNIPYSTFVAVRAELSDLESLKDADGDTITNSLGLLKMEAIYNMKGLTDKQRQALFEYMGVGKNVIHYNPALVKQKLAVMRKKAQ